MTNLENSVKKIYGIETPGHVRSPLRICPLGAHVDHQNGLVTGMALDVNVNLLFAPDKQGFVRVQSMDFPDEDYFQIDHVPDMLPGFWGNYLRGAVLSLARFHKLRYGIKGIIQGKLPMGGLSSSAAVITAYLLALCEVNDIPYIKEDLIQWSHWVETSYIGLNNGILDQSANILSERDSLMLMDCASGEWSLVKKGSMMPKFEIVIVNSGFNKSLMSTDYNNRVDECKIAACILEEITYGKITSYKDAKLRNIKIDEWKKHESALPGRFAKRARHFFTENERVAKGIDAWRSGELVEFGKLMFESGDSSINNYQCGCTELITIFEILKATPGVYGARFSGAGYRGCCIGIINPEFKDEIRSRISKLYPEAHPDYADKYSIHFCTTANGASIVSPYGK
jgi:galacturonokinase